MPSFEYRKGIRRITPNPADEGGQALNGNFDYIGDRLYNLGVDATADEWGMDGTDEELDASEAVQNVVDSLALTGGTVFLPPTRRYAWANTVVIRSHFPIHVVSRMDGLNIAKYGFGTATRGFIFPIDDLPDGFFKWELPVGAVSIFDSGGGWADGLAFLDLGGATTEAPGDYDIHSCLNFTDNNWSGARNCGFFRIKGRAIYFENAQCNVHNCQSRWCGDSASSKPIMDLTNAHGFSHVTFRDCQIESSYSNVANVAAGAALAWYDGYCEQTTQNANQNHILFVGDGAKKIKRANFGRSNVKYIEFKNDGDELIDTTFGAGSNTNLTAEFFTWTGNGGTISNVTVQDAPSQVLHAVTISGTENEITLLRAIRAGNINITQARNRLRNPVVYASVSTQPYQIPLYQLTKCHDAYVFGGITNGILIGDLASCQNATVEVTAADKNGIVAGTFSSVMKDNHAFGASGTGANFVYSSFCKASGNVGYPTTVTAALPFVWLSTATLHAESGLMTTSAAIATAPGDSHVVEITNALVSTGSRITASMGRVTESASTSYMIMEIRPLAGFFQIIFRNTSTTSALNGSVGLAFKVEN